jgi:hypothetical protein
MSRVLIVGSERWHLLHGFAEIALKMALDVGAEAIQPRAPELLRLCEERIPGLTNWQPEPRLDRRLMETASRLPNGRLNPICQRRT